MRQRLGLAAGLEPHDIIGQHLARVTVHQKHVAMMLKGADASIPIAIEWTGPKKQDFVRVEGDRTGDSSSDSLVHAVASPDFSHHLCTIEQICATICSILCGRAALWRREDARIAGTFAGLRGAAKEGYRLAWMMPAVVTRCGSAIRRVSRGRWPQR
jgi:hypothetical protein